MQVTKLADKTHEGCREKGCYKVSGLYSIFEYLSVDLLGVMPNVLHLLPMFGGWDCFRTKGSGGGE